MMWGDEVSLFTVLFTTLISKERPLEDADDCKQFGTWTMKLTSHAYFPLSSHLYMDHLYIYLCSIYIRNQCEQHCRFSKKKEAFSVFFSKINQQRCSRSKNGVQKIRIDSPEMWITNKKKSWITIYKELLAPGILYIYIYIAFQWNIDNWLVTGWNQ